jgi:hypothetical protein
MDTYRVTTDTSPAALDSQQLIHILSRRVVDNVCVQGTVDQIGTEQNKSVHEHLWVRCERYVHDVYAVCGQCCTVHDGGIQRVVL